MNAPPIWEEVQSPTIRGADESRVSRDSAALRRARRRGHDRPEETTHGLNALQRAADLPGVDVGDARSVGMSGVEA